MATKFYNISTDTTLGGSTPSDYTVVSQKAIKTYVDSQTEHIFVNFTQSGEVVSCDKRITDISNASINGYVVIGRLGNSLFHLIGNSANTVSFISYDGDYINGTVVSNVDTWTHTSVDYVVNPIAAPTAGQVLANDGNGNNYWTNVGGVGYLDSDTNLWTLTENLYFVKEGIRLYFDGSLVSRYIPSTGGLLSVSPKGAANVWHYYPVEGSTQTELVVHNGYSSATTGDYKTSQLPMTTTNDSSIAVGAFNSVEVSDFNVNDDHFSKNGILLISTVQSTLNQPLSIAAQAPYRGVLAITSANDFFASTQNEFNIRQDLYVPSLNRHFYRIAKYYNSVFVVNTGIANCDANGWVEVLDTLPSFAGNNGKVLGLTNNGLEWVNGGGGGGSIATLSDVSLTTLTDGQTLEYNATSQKWENKDNVSCIYYEY